MPEIEFTIDPMSGKLELHVKGIAGPGCEDVATLAEQLLGRPAVDRDTAEYHLRPRVQPRVRPKRG